MAWQDPAAADELYALLMEHDVLLFRAAGITPEQQARVACSFGDPEPRHPSYYTHVVHVDGEPCRV